MKTFALPDLGEGLEEAEIVAWHVAQGDRVGADQPLVAVETDKAVVEVPAPFAGRVLALHGAPGDTVKVGAPLVDIETGESPDTGTVVGELPTTPERASPTRSARPSPTPITGRAKAMPAVRGLATELGVDIERLAGTGPGGFVTSDDVKAAAGTRSVASEPLRGLRRAMARAMARARLQAVPATVTDEADVDAWPAGEDVTLRLIRALVSGCKAEPALNAGYDGDGRRLHEHVAVGLAVDTPNGLIVPVLRDADRKPTEALRVVVERLKRAVVDRSIAPEDLRGATITLSNFGTLGGRHAALVVTPPQVAILGAGRLEPRPVARAGGIVAHGILPLSLTFDHRVVTGGEAARFLAAVKADLEHPT
ncbi:MAG: dihydrolipoamide acetyltransferase family protein [Alphaproteobacteria bacterium]